MENNKFHAYIGLGSNLGDPIRQLSLAFEDLACLPQTSLLHRSGFYQTAPVGVDEIQPDYINACAQLSTKLSPIDLLSHLMAIEKKHGRTRKEGERWRARLLDLDLLIYESVEMISQTLHLPHPRMMERLFVIAPLYELIPDYVFSNGTPIATLLDALQQDGSQKVVKLEAKSE